MPSVVSVARRTRGPIPHAGPARAGLHGGPSSPEPRGRPAGRVVVAIARKLFSELSGDGSQRVRGQVRSGQLWLLPALLLMLVAVTAPPMPGIGYAPPGSPTLVAAVSAAP